MMRLVNTILVFVMLAGAGFVYYLKYDAEQSSNRLARMHRSLAQEREAIATLSAEWSLLNQPRRLQDYADKYHSYLELDRLDPDQVATIDDIPLRNPQAAGPARSIASIIANTKSGDLTGTVKKPAAKPVDKPADKPKPPGKPLELKPNAPVIRVTPNAGPVR